MRSFGLIGKTLKHSFSEKYFNKKFESEGILDCNYENYELQSISDLPALINSNQSLVGLNVTIPYKEEVISYLHYKNEVVQKIGACNCIYIDSNRKLNGYNTDVIGFKQSLEDHLLPHHNKALILGSGGASKAVMYVLDELKIKYYIISRKKMSNSFSYEELNEGIIKSHLLIINTTPLGMYPNTEEKPPIPYKHLTENHLLFDLIYNPEKTEFLLEGERRGATICNGNKMLLIQAEESWRIWNTINKEK